MWATFTLAGSKAAAATQGQTGTYMKANSIRARAADKALSLSQMGFSMPVHSATAKDTELASWSCQARFDTRGALLLASATGSVFALTKAPAFERTAGSKAV